MTDWQVCAERRGDDANLGSSGSCPRPLGHRGLLPLDVEEGDGAPPEQREIQQLPPAKEETGVSGAGTRNAAAQEVVDGGQVGVRTSSARRARRSRRGGGGCGSSCTPSAR